MKKKQKHSFDQIYILRAHLLRLYCFNGPAQKAEGQSRYLHIVSSRMESFRGWNDVIDPSHQHLANHARFCIGLWRRSASWVLGPRWRGSVCYRCNFFTGWQKALSLRYVYYSISPMFQINTPCYQIANFNKRTVLNKNRTVIQITWI